MPDYKKGKIYRIVCNTTGEQYFGSTTRTLGRRLCGHRSPSNQCASRQIIERGNYEIILCEEYPCDNKQQLHERERFWIEIHNCINKMYKK